MFNTLYHRLIGDEAILCDTLVQIRSTKHTKVQLYFRHLHILFFRGKLYKLIARNALILRYFMPGLSNFGKTPLVHLG